MTRTEPTLSSRFVCTPVTATRRPTCFWRLATSGAPTRSTVVECFVRKPVRQLRDFGALAPSVSVNRKRSLFELASRQPVIVTWEAAFVTVAAGTGADAVMGAAALAERGPGDDAVSCVSTTGDEAVGRLDAVAPGFWMGSAGVFFADGSGCVVAAGFAIGVADGASAGGRTADGTASTGAVESNASGFEFSVGGGTSPDRRGTASTATTSVAIAASVITREYDVPPTPPDGGAGDTGLTRGAESPAGGVIATAVVFEAGALTLGGVDTDGPCRAPVFGVRRFVRDCFGLFDALDVRADFFPSTSAETSNVQRTRRPVLGGGILIARFDTMIRPRQVVCREVIGRKDGIQRWTLTR